MTLLIAWVGVDCKKEGKSIASLYIGSDSRFSAGNARYDHGNKVFGAHSSPDIFGICGDILFPTMVLNQIISRIDRGVFFSGDESAAEKSERIHNYVRTGLANYPGVIMDDNFTILYGTKVGERFHLFKTYYERPLYPVIEEIDLPNYSTAVFSGGSGGNSFDDNWLTWRSEKHNDHRTSRAAYHCLEHTIETTDDPATGGLPQIMGLYRKGNSRLFGVIKDGIRYLYGTESEDGIQHQNVEWRNENFERMDPETLELIEGAQRQPRS
jgi:hypothetical protein